MNVMYQYIKNLYDNFFKEENEPLIEEEEDNLFNHFNIMPETLLSIYCSIFSDY